MHSARSKRARPAKACLPRASPWQAIAGGSVQRRACCSSLIRQEYACTGRYPELLHSQSSPPFVNGPRKVVQGLRRKTRVAAPVPRQRGIYQCPLDPSFKQLQQPLFLHLNFPKYWSYEWGELRDMKDTYLYLLTWSALIAGCSNHEHRSLNEFNPIVISRNGPELIQYWEFPDGHYLWEDGTGEASDLMAYRDSLITLLGDRTFSGSVQREGNLDAHYFNTNELLNGDQKNAALVHNGTLGHLRRINFTEAQLLNYQLTRYPLLGHPTEFVAYIEVHEEEELVRVYFCSSDEPWPPKHHVVFSAIEKDLGHGWKLKYALHNHYEPDTNNYVGILAPSMSDVQMFKMMKEEYALETALITNGFHTVAIENDDFHRFESY